MAYSVIKFCVAATHDFVRRRTIRAVFGLASTDRRREAEVCGREGGGPEKADGEMCRLGWLVPHLKDD